MKLCFTLLFFQTNYIFQFLIFADEIPTGIISVRVDYTRTYNILLTSVPLIHYYGFDVELRNDVDDVIFAAIQSRSTFVQLVAYLPTGTMIILYLLYE